MQEIFITAKTVTEFAQKSNNDNVIALLFIAKDKLNTLHKRLGKQLTRVSVYDTCVDIITILNRPVFILSASYLKNMYCTYCSDICWNFETLTVTISHRSSNL